MYNDLEYKNKIVVGLIVTLALLFFSVGVAVYLYCLPVVTLQVDNVAIRQDEALPELTVHAEYSGKQNLILDENTGYSVEDLVQDLNQGKGYLLVNDADNTKEGSYKLKLDFVQELKDQFVFSWN